MPAAETPTESSVAEGPLCFLHIPKSAGMSFHNSLETALPPGTVSGRRCDWTSFCQFDAYDELLPETRATVAATDDEILELGAYRALGGHFALPNLLKITPAANIATVLREPRTRLLSLYAYFRLSPWLIDFWQPYALPTVGRRALDEVLADPQLAVATDNVVCRYLMHGDRRLPSEEFIASHNVAAVAAEAIGRLDSLGFVGVLELGEPTWSGFGSFFGVTMTERRDNASGSLGGGDIGSAPVTAITAETLRLLRERTAGDSLLYAHALRRHGYGDDQARILSDVSLANQLIRTGDLLGSTAAAQRRQEQESDALRTELDRERQQTAELAATVTQTQADLARHQQWLSGIQGSLSWRMTVPLRTAKRAALRYKSGALQRIR